MSRMFLEISMNFCEISRNFPEISEKFLDNSWNFPGAPHVLAAASRAAERLYSGIDTDASGLEHTEDRKPRNS